MRLTSGALETTSNGSWSLKAKDANATMMMMLLKIKKISKIYFINTNIGQKNKGSLYFYARVIEPVTPCPLHVTLKPKNNQ